MKHLALVAAVFAAIAMAACVKGPEGQANGSSGSPAKSSELVESSPPADRSAVSQTTPAASGSTLASQNPARSATTESRDLCALLSSKEVAEITGLPIERVEKQPNGCEWYANAAARQQQGAETARNTLEKLSKQEPASADEVARSMESLLKGVGGAVAPDRPLFAVSVRWENADQAEAILKGTVAAIGGGLPGGRLEPIEGLGDRAYVGPVGSFFYVRKGPALITFGLSVGTREQAVALARLIVSRI